MKISRVNRWKAHLIPLCVTWQWTGNSTEATRETFFCTFDAINVAFLDKKKIKEKSFEEETSHSARISKGQRPFGI